MIVVGLHLTRAPVPDETHEDTQWVVAIVGQQAHVRCWSSPLNGYVTRLSTSHFDCGVESQRNPLLEDLWFAKPAEDGLFLIGDDYRQIAGAGLEQAM